MCTAKSPTPKDPVKKDPIYMRNSYLDGLGLGGGSQGRNSLRIDPGSEAPRAPLAPPSGASMSPLGIGGTTDGTTEQMRLMTRSLAIAP